MTIVAALTLGIVWNNYRQASAAALKTADNLFYQITVAVDENVNGMLGGVRTAVDAASAMPSLSRRPRYDGLSHVALATMIEIVEARAYIYAVSAGFANGGWIQVLAPRGDADVMATFQVPEGAAFVVRTISENREGRRYEYLRYLDLARRVVGARTLEDPDYDPRRRNWYEGAIAADRTLFTDPFVFAALKKPGITASRRLVGGSGVFTISVTLTNFANMLSDYVASPNAIAFLFNSRGEILAYHDPDSADPFFAGGANAAASDTGLHNAADLGLPIVARIVGDSLGADATAMRRLEFDGETYLVRVATVGQELGLDQFVAVVAPLADFTQHIAEMQRRNIVTALVALAVALPLIFLISRRVAAKLATLAGEADRIRAFDLESPVAVTSRFVEVHNLSRAFGSMKEAVRMFGRYVPRDLVREILQAGTPPELGGRRQEISVLFTDIAGFTRIAEETDPEILMLRTSEYFEALGAVLSEHEGVVDKYIGDAIMALWNAPSRDDDHVAHACAAVLACQRAGRALAEDWAKRGIPPFVTRFGLHCGEAVVGNVGGADRINFTAVGATINLAARLEALNKQYGTEILVSEQIAARTQDRYLMRVIDRVQPVGINAPGDVHELMAARPGSGEELTALLASDAQCDLHELWERAYRRYRERDWPAALAAFESVLQRHPQDGPAQLFVDRCREFLDQPPAADWDGVNRPESK